MINKKVEPPYPYTVITPKQRDNDFEKLKNIECDKITPLSRVGNKVSNYYFEPYRIKTKCGKWSYWSAWEDEYKRKKIIQLSMKLYRKRPKVMGTPVAYRHSIKMVVGTINQFKPQVAVCQVYKRFKPKRILDTSAGWGDRLIGAMSQDIDYIGIEQNENLTTPYKRMITDFKNKSSSKVMMIFKKSQDVDYSKLPPYDLVFTSPPYFDLEKYEGMEIFESKEKFLQEYFKPTIKKSYEYLEIGGHLALNMPEEMYISLQPLLGSCDSKIELPIHNPYAWKGLRNIFHYIYVWNKRGL